MFRTTMRVLLNLLLAVPLAGASACDPNEATDAGMDASCDVTLAIAIGTGDRDSFTPVTGGQNTELILGFQGFRMIALALQVSGPAADTADLTTFISVTDTDIELSQNNRRMPIVDGTGGDRIVEDHLIFFNDAPASELVGREVQVELIARSGGCTGTATTGLTLVDEDDCVDPDIIIPDAGTIDGGVPDGAVVCETM
ncbi:MAG: hypothetical protein JRH11_18210 [Deltaproteobacteria bacterium]|nr:hypothetical protein [Deltaproteobacteria bacterium]